jgi:hypothetical protein
VTPSSAGSGTSSYVAPSCARHVSVRAAGATIRASKVLYLVATEKRPNRANPTGKVNGWTTILNALTIHFGERIAPDRLTVLTPVPRKIGLYRTRGVQ